MPVGPKPILPQPGRKVTQREDELREQAMAFGHHRPGSKVKLFWNGEEQRVEWAY